MQEKKDKNKFYLFKIDKDKIRLQLKNIGSKFSPKKTRSRGLTLLITFFLLVGVGIAIYNNEMKIQNEEAESGVTIESLSPRSDENIVEQGVDDEDLKLTINQLTLNKPREENEPETPGQERETPEKMVEDSPAEGVVTRPITPLKEREEQKISLLRPVSGELVRDPGWYYHPVFSDWRYQHGIILEGRIGQIVMAADSGRVLSVGEDDYRGIMVIVEHGSGWKTVYGHLQKASVSPGEVVGKGQEIGRIGETGIAAQPGLYFELVSQEGSLNPEEYFE